MIFSIERYQYVVLIPLNQLLKYNALYRKANKLLFPGIFIDKRYKGVSVFIPGDKDTILKDHCRRTGNAYFFAKF